MSAMADGDADDPFREGSRTFVMPTPGARAGATPMADRGADVATDIESPDSGLNPLVALANPLLAVMPQIRATPRLADPAALKESLAQSLRDFDARASQHGIAPERVMAARYVLCTALDEAAAGTPWGGLGAWGRHSLLVTFHNETFGGEKVFQLMAKLADRPAANRDLLELIYATLSLGFQGRYGAIDNGAAQLQAVRTRLAQILAKERGDYPRPLAEHWAGTKAERARFASWLPLWVSAAVVTALLIGAFWALTISLGARSDPVFAKIQALRLPGSGSTVTAVTGTAPPASARVAPFLDAEIRAGEVSVQEAADRSVIRIRGDGLFEPASAVLDPRRAALVRRIAEALARLPGQVMVVGHTDDTPIKSMRFPSNWELSQARAETVRSLLADDGIAAARLSAEGRAAGEPLVANDSPANRRTNRRVEVILMPAKTGAGA